jgi:uncharacterized delta-60 repeat protein
VPARSIVPRIAVLVATAVAVVSSTAPAQGASSNIVVALEVSTHTELSLVGCPAAAYDFGTVLPGTSRVTPADCEVSFGSGNSTPTLQAVQADGHGRSLFGRAWGPLDTLGFGVGGNVLEATSANGPRAGVVRTTRDGKVVIGTWESLTATRRVEIRRFTSAGAPDPTWDGTSQGGAVGLARFNPTGGSDGVIDLEVLDDGSVIAAVTANLTAAGATTYVVKWGSTGLLDTTFGESGSGWTEVDISVGHAEQAYSLDVLADGSILTMGNARGAVAGTDLGWVLKLDANGDRIMSYGTNAVVSVPVACSGCGNTHVVGAALADGSVHLTGRRFVGGDWDVMLARIDPAGVPVAGYPVASLDLIAGQNDESRTSLPLPDGRTAIAGWNGTNETGYVAMLLADGSLDTTFGDPSVGPKNGVLWIPGASAVRGLLLQPEDGKLVAVGRAGASGVEDLMVARMSTDGVLDRGFGTNGVQVHSIGTTNDYIGYPNHGAFGPDGSYYLVSDHVSGATERIQLTRLVGRTVPDYGESGAGWSAGAGGMFGACLSDAAGGAAAAWVEEFACTQTDLPGTAWRGIGSTASTVATAPLGTQGALARLRFGVRLPTSQTPGRYLAPITFSVLAP